MNWAFLIFRALATAVLLFGALAAVLWREPLVAFVLLGGMVLFRNWFEDL